MPYLPPAVLPPTLWKNERYHVARHLQAAYEQELTARNLIDLAKSNAKKHVFGGASLEDTNAHFALRFFASVVRVQNVILDTKSAFGKIPSDLLETFSSHKISMLDIPCGTGAGALGVLSVVHELRLAGILPTLPIHVKILAADVSPHAIEIYRDQLEHVRTALKTTAIALELTTREWDAADLLSTHDLCEEWLRTVDEVNESLVLVTNFSGAGNLMFDKFKESWRHISVRTASKNATMLWVEPGDPGGKTFLKNLSAIIRSLFRINHDEDHEPPFSEAKWWHSLNEQEFAIRSSVLHYTRPQ
ncbi:hypothetical protein Sinac_4537 [Singulisphaera acidiphila DSM 18658]|uniref:Uncharacterized protein n=2 Tax=Singulisphaera acidiphila TaxID=466153 RepID=L0DH71_SINAD|nr:hypothetical protein Sinac_4537 [Singulisphaera acidiphila DSM 18658]